MSHRLRLSLPIQIALLAVWSVGWAAYTADRWGWLVSWFFFMAGPRRLAGLPYHHFMAPGGLHLYGSYPRLQIGPVTFLVALPLALLPTAPSKTIACAVMFAAGPAIIWLVADAVTRVRGHSRRAAFRAAAWVWVLLTPSWSLLAMMWGHLDDVLALLFVAAAVNLQARGRFTLAAVLVGASAASKPWGLAFIPLVLAATDGHRVRHLLTAIAAAVGPWLPFVIADPHTLRAASFKIRVISSSVLGLFHVVGGTPSWVRPCQFIGGALLVALGVRSGRWAAGVVLAIALRLGTDPNVYSYYTTGLLVGAAIWDLLGSRFRLPVLTATCVASLYVSSYLSVSPHDHAVLRLATVVAVPIIIALTSERGSPPTEAGAPDTLPRMRGEAQLGLQPTQ